MLRERCKPTMKEPYCFSRHLNAHPSSSEQLESVPERKGCARCVSNMNPSSLAHCRPPARGQPGRVGQERVMQHQVGVAPTHIAPVRSDTPAGSCSARAPPPRPASAATRASRGVAQVGIAFWRPSEAAGESAASLAKGAGTTPAEQLVARLLSAGSMLPRC